MTLVAYILLINLTLFSILASYRRSWRHKLVYVLIVGYVLIAYFGTAIAEYRGWVDSYVTSGVAFNVINYYAFICGALLLTSFFITASPPLRVNVRREYRRVFLVSIAVALIPIYIIALYTGILRIGLDADVALPFRLNGILRNLSTIVLPVVLFRILHMRGQFVVSFGVACLLFFVNLAATGSKYLAITPIAIYVFCLILDRGLSRWIAFPALMVLSLYFVMNPYRARELLRDSDDIGIIQVAEESITYNWRYGDGINAEEALGNLLRRITGHLDLERVLHVKSGILPWRSDVIEQYNNQLAADFNAAAAPGYYGYFVLFTGSPWGGVVVGTVGLILLIGMGALLGRLASWDLTLPGYSAAILPLVIDGDLGRVGPLLDVVFCVIILIVISHCSRMRAAPAAFDSLVD